MSPCWEDVVSLPSKRHFFTRVRYWSARCATRGSLFLLVFPLVEGESAGWPWWALICLLLSVPCLIAFLAYEHWTTRQGKTPLVSLLLFRQRRFPAGLLTIVLASALFAAEIGRAHV